MRGVQPLKPRVCCCLLHPTFRCFCSPRPSHSADIPRTAGPSWDSDAAPSVLALCTRRAVLRSRNFEPGISLVRCRDGSSVPPCSPHRCAPGIRSNGRDPRCSWCIPRNGHGARCGWQERPYSFPWACTPGTAPSAATAPGSRTVRPHPRRRAAPDPRTVHPRTGCDFRCRPQR